MRSTPLPEQPRIPTRELALSNTLVTLSNHLRAALAPAACGRGCAWGDEAYSTDALNEEGQLSGRRVSSPHTPSSFSPHPSPRREACRALSAAAAAQWVNNLSPVRGKILPYRRGAAEWRGTQRHRCVPCGQLLYSLPFLVLVQAPSELCLIGTRTFQGCFDTSISRPSFTETRITHRTRDTSNTCGHHAAPRMAPRRVSSWIYPSISDYSPQRGKRTCNRAAARHRRAARPEFNTDRIERAHHRVRIESFPSMCGSTYRIRKSHWRWRLAPCLLTLGVFGGLRSLL